MFIKKLTSDLHTIKSISAAVVLPRKPNLIGNWYSRKQVISSSLNPSTIKIHRFIQTNNSRPEIIKFHSHRASINYQPTTIVHSDYGCCPICPPLIEIFKDVSGNACGTSSYTPNEINHVKGNLNREEYGLNNYEIRNYLFRILWADNYSKLIK